MLITTGKNTAMIMKKYNNIPKATACETFEGSEVHNM